MSSAWASAALAHERPAPSNAEGVRPPDLNRGFDLLLRQAFIQRAHGKSGEFRIRGETKPDQLRLLQLRDAWSCRFGQELDKRSRSSSRMTRSCTLRA